MAAYVMYGFDSAAELSEETSEPRRTTPRAILRAMYVSGLGGALLLVGTLMAAPSLSDGHLGSSGISWVVTSQLGGGWGKALLVDVAISIISACLAIQNSASRVMFSMARDGVLPFSRALARVNAATGTPVRTSVVIGVLAIGVLLVNLGQASVFTAVTSVSVVIVYLAYLLVTVPALVRRLRSRGRHPLVRSGGESPGSFVLGRWGLLVNLVAVVYGFAMLVNMAWPRAEVYDPEGGHWALRFFPELFLVAALAVGAGFFLAQRHRLRAAMAHAEPVPAD
jgi:urea carboxylase system permease